LAKKLSIDERPSFPKRAVVTGGMPYGNKKLHFGHIGGVFVFADVFTLFLTHRIGAYNVIFVSGQIAMARPLPRVTASFAKAATRAQSRILSPKIIFRKKRRLQTILSSRRFLKALL
jgi:hypothetical protein